MRTMMNKIMLLKHIRSLPQSSVAKQVNNAESLPSRGLNYEVKMFCEINNVKQPNNDDTKDEYRKYLTKRLHQLMREELQAKLRNSSTMNEVSEERFETKTYLCSKKLKVSRFMFACRTGTTDMLAGNVYGAGGDTTCLCGNHRETSSHVSQCPLYSICKEGLSMWNADADQRITYWLRLLRLGADLKHHIQNSATPRFDPG